MVPYPAWLHILSWAYLVLSFVCAVVILLDEIRLPQEMMIMNFVWPITALYFGPLAVWGYLKSGRKMAKLQVQRMHIKIKDELDAEKRASQTGTRKSASQPPAQPSREQVAVGVSHCGAGCTLGDIGAEWRVFLMGLTFAGGEFQTRILMDFLLAWTFGVAFQYFTIAPVRGLSLRKGLLQAIRADTFSIVAFQIGMFAWMAFTYFVIFPKPHLKLSEATFWFMMQVGMMIGYFTSYPANVALLNRGLKEKMPQYKPEMKRRMREEQESRAA